MFSSAAIGGLSMIRDKNAVEMNPDPQLGEDDFHMMSESSSRLSGDDFDLSDSQKSLRNSGLSKSLDEIASRNGSMLTKTKESPIVDEDEFGSFRVVRNESANTRLYQSAPSEPEKKTTNDKIWQLWGQGKSKLIGSFYNLIHSSPTEVPKLSEVEPIYLMGKCFRPNFDLNSGRHTLDTQTRGFLQPSKSDFEHLTEFCQEFEKILWFTYRKDFAPLEPTKLTNDIGWGCMLRTGQMMLAQGFIQHFYQRNFDFSIHQRDFAHSPYRQVLRWFADSPASSSPYSIHRMVYDSQAIEAQATTTSSNANKVGEWFTPTRVCNILKRLVRQHSPESLTMYVPNDGVIYRDKVISLCTSRVHETPSPPLPRRNEKNSMTWSQLRESFSSYRSKEDDDRPIWRPIIIFVPLRLGVEKIHPKFYDSMKVFLDLPFSLGMIGGRPRQSLYFVGYQGNDVFYLDPHVAHSAKPQTEGIPDYTYHTKFPQKMPIFQMDPSLAFGFYIQDQDEFQAFYSFLSTRLMSDPDTILIDVQETEPTY